MKDMKRLTAIIETSSENYSAYIEGVDGVTATGATIDEVKQNLVEAVEELVEFCKETGSEIPDELTGDYDLTFVMDTKSVLEHYSGIFSKSALERMTGINQKQLWHYASGLRKPRRAQTVKIERALHKLGADLLALQLS